MTEEQARWVATAFYGQRLISKEAIDGWASLLMTIARKIEDAGWRVHFERIDGRSREETERKVFGPHRH